MWAAAIHIFLTSHAGTPAAVAPPLGDRIASRPGGCRLAEAGARLRLSFCGRLVLCCVAWSRLLSQASRELIQQPAALSSSAATRQHLLARKSRPFFSLGVPRRRRSPLYSRPAGWPAAALVAFKFQRCEGTTRSSGGRSSTRKFSIACDAVLCEDHDQMQRRRTVNGLGGAGNQVVLYTTNKARNRVSIVLERQFRAADPTSMLLFCPRQGRQSTEGLFQSPQKVSEK